MSSIKLKRVYDGVDSEDGYRVLVDRIWPRGVKKEAAALDRWEKEIAPSTELRKWFGHEPERFREFKKKYKEELKAHIEDLQQLKSISEERDLTLLYGAKDKEHNQAIVLLEVLKDLD